MEPAWAIITTRSMCEDVVERGLWQSGYRAYVPRFRKVIQPHGTQRKPAATMRPVFSGLVFAQDWRGWPTQPISHVIGLMKSTRSGGLAKLSGQDVRFIMDRELAGLFDKMARPPSNGTLTRDDLVVGERVEFDLSDNVMQAVLDGLSDDGRATVRSMILGRWVKTEVDADTLRVVSA